MSWCADLDAVFEQLAWYLAGLRSCARFCFAAISRRCYQMPYAARSRNSALMLSLFRLFLLTTATTLLAVPVIADAPLPCASLQAEELLVESMPSSSCFTGLVQGAQTLYDRFAEGSSLDDDVIDILLPFPFRWFGVLYENSVYVGSNSYITFGGSKVVFSDFNVFNPPLPSVFIGAADLTMQRLIVGRVPQGWLVRYEGALLGADDVDPDTGLFVVNSTMIWELQFFSAGGLQLCTGILNHSAPNNISAISHQQSSAFAHTFTLQQNFQYRFATTCAAVNRVSLSTPIASVSGVQLDVMLFLTLNASDVFTWTITLRGAGFSCPPNSSFSIISVPSSLLALGKATIIASNSSSPSLVFSGITGAINGSIVLSVRLSGITTPHEPQDAFSNLGFAVHGRSGNLVISGNSILLDAVVPPLLLEQTPLLQLSVPVISQTEVSLQINVSPTSANVIFRQYVPKALMITLSGEGWWLDPDHVATTAKLGWQPVATSISALDSMTFAIRIDFDAAHCQAISSITPLILTMSPITTPRSIQNSLLTIKSAVLNSYDSILASGARGRLGAIFSSTMGSDSPSISFSPPLRDAHDSVLDIKMAPTFWTEFQKVPYLIPPATGPAIVITLSGQGIVCPVDAPVMFFLPFSGASGVASIDSSNAKFPVLSVTISSGTFEAGLPIWFQVGPVSTPSFEQPEIGNITSIIYGDDGSGEGNTVAIAASVSGTMDRIVGGMGANQPTIQHAIVNGEGKLFLSFTPSASLPENSMIFVTITGLGLTCPDLMSVSFTSPALSAMGSASILNEPLSSVLIVSVPNSIFAGINVSFSLSPVFASFPSKSTLNNVHASVADRNGRIVVASVSGSFAASMTSVSPALTVKDYIASATNGTILLPSGVFAGSTNCNNVINETMPSRSLGSAVVLKSDGKGAIIDCSGTSMRCLVVYRSSISIKSITFKGGSSANFVQSSTLRMIRAVYDEMSRVTDTAQSEPFAYLNAPKTLRFESWKNKYRDIPGPATDAVSEMFFRKSSRSHHQPSNFALSNRGVQDAHRIDYAENRRRLLQSSSVTSFMFKPQQDSCGGCLLVDAYGHESSLSSVAFLGCHALYGGGAFFNVSAFTATEGLASNNVAQQGGGLFVASTAGSTIKSFSFVNNTVATFLPSGFETARDHLGKFLLLPDPSAAAGGGAWFQLLNNAVNCTFLDNTAIAAGTPVTSWTGSGMSGAHALGSGMFVLETRSLRLIPEIRLASLAQLVFRRSSQHCAGWCVAGGALFVGVTDGGTMIWRITFENVAASAVASESSISQCGSSKSSCIGPSVALGSCVVIVDMSSNPMSTIRDIYAESVSTRAVGSIHGGCITFLQKFANAAAFNISVSNAILTSIGGPKSDNTIRGLLAANSLFNSSISLITTRNTSLTCSNGDVVNGGIYGGVLYSQFSAQIRISLFVTEGTILRSTSRIYGGVVYLENSFHAIVIGTLTSNSSFSIWNHAGGAAECFGGVLHLKTSFDSQVLDSVTESNQLQCISSYNQCSGKSCRCKVKGGFSFFGTSVRLSLLNSSAQNVIMTCQGKNCSTAGGLLGIEFSTNISVAGMSLSNCSLACSGAFCTTNGAVLSLDSEAQLFTNISGIISNNSSVACIGKGCYSVGGLILVFAASLPKSSNAVDACYNAGTSLSDIHSINVSVACVGESCFVLGGIVYFEEVFCLAVNNVTSFNLLLSSKGNNSRAAGSLIGIGASNGSVLTGIISVQSTVLSDGDFGQAFGGAISILSGKVSIKSSTFAQSAVQCSGYKCAASGGFLSLVSTLIYNPFYRNQISIDNSRFSFGNVSCAGFACFASGGVLVSGTSFRASKWLNEAIPSLDSSAPPQVAVAIQSCMFQNNTVSAFSVAASIGGGALAISSSVASLFNCSFVGNSILYSNIIAFAGGGALHITNSRCIVTAKVCLFSFNDASSVGQGGALLAASGAKFVGSELEFSSNRAGQGGGVLIDASDVQIENSDIHDNSAVTSGGGMFCSGNQANDAYLRSGLGMAGISAITLKNVSLRSNYVVDPSALGVGADLFVVGSVFFAADNASTVSMSGRADRDITAAAVSVITDSPSIFLKLECLSGTMLRLAPTSLSNMVSRYMPPSMESLLASNCFPACLAVPEYEKFVAVSGFLASCTPCPRGTYNLGSSNSTSDTVASFCFACPFGADCSGGSMVQTLDSYWGWKLSETGLPKEFLLLPEGYGCEGSDCEDIGSCGHNHSSVLCGGCNKGYSAAFFTTDCVSDEECADWKLWVLVFLSFVYSLFYSIFLRYDSQTLKPPPSGPIEPTRTKRVSIAEIKQEKRSSAFRVLMWYYQLVGLLLAMPNPLKFLDGNALIINFLGLIFGTVPVSQALDLPSLVFCTKAGSAPADIIFANIAFYVIWAMVMVALSFKRIWLPIFRLCQAIFNLVPEFWDNYESACEALAVWGTVGKFFAFFLALKWSASLITWAATKAGTRRVLLAFASRLRSAWKWLVIIVSCKQCGTSSPSVQDSTVESALKQRVAVYPGEVRGQAWLDFGVTAYSALLSLMIQCTTCVTIGGYQVEGSALPEVRWFYDGRVACFSDAGEQSGRWQIAALIAVVVLTALPMVLAIYMSRVMNKCAADYSVFDISALPAYLQEFNSSNKHWFSVM
jgi:hypothetical protein